MKKVFLVVAILLLSLSILLPGCSSGNQTSTTELKFSYWPPPADKWVQRGILPWGDEIEKATNGKIKINYFGGATLGAPPDHLDLVKKGTADIGWINPAFTPSVFPLTDIRNLPFLYPNVQVANKVFWRQQEYLNPLEYKDVKVLWTFATPVMELSTTKKPIRTLEDLKGLKFGETEPMAARTDNIMGLVPQVMQETEIYTALGNGMLDGRWQEYNGLVTWKCGEVTKYRVDNVRIFVHQNMIIMNLQTYNKLPADVRKAIDDTTGFKKSSASGDVWAGCEQDSRAEILAQDKAKGNPEPYMLPESERARWIAAAQPAIDDWLKEMDGKGLGQKARELLEKTKQWVAEYSK
jgi:TRAP-type C4-dicarboxylate transport system substrate-binding protein